MDRYIEIQYKVNKHKMEIELEINLF